MRLRSILGCAMIFGALFNVSAQDAKQSFQEFRKGLHKDYNAFRSRILEHYADFLEGEWHPYEPLIVPERYTEPKPDKAPVKSSKPSSPQSSSPSSPSSPKLISPASPKTPVSTKAPASPEVSPTPVKPDTSETSDSPSAPKTPTIQDSDNFDFYGMRLSIPKVRFNILNNIARNADTAAQWRTLDDGNARSAVTALNDLASDLGLNGYLTFRLCENYVNSRFPQADRIARFCVVHYLMANMGYDVRLAIAGNNLPLLLMPFTQTVYGSLYLNFDGKNYTALPPEDVRLDASSIGSIYTCQLPKGQDAGRSSDLRINGLNLPYEPYEFDITGGDLHIKGVTNRNLFNLLYHYPQMPTEDFATSTLDAQVRRDIASQVKEQLSGMPADKAVNTLMRFFHEGLPYATDEQRHGFEKPYFLEETLYYDKCDCEDRAIMFTWLVWNTLGLPAHLNAYPGHESAAVAVDCEDAGPYAYTFEGLTFRNTDPTYIGSHIGDVMPQFSSTSPKIDLQYK